MLTQRQIRLERGDPKAIVLRKTAEERVQAAREAEVAAFMLQDMDTSKFGEAR